MAKMMNPNTTIWWVPEDGIADPYNVTVTEVNAGENISCAIVTGYTLNATDSSTDDTRSICDEGNVENPTFDNYEASLTFFRTDQSAPTTGVDIAYDSAYELFKHKNASGYLVRRIGKRNNVLATEGDVVSVFKVLSDNPRDLAGGDEGPIQMTVPFLQQGFMALNVTLGEDEEDETP